MVYIVVKIIKKKTTSIHSRSYLNNTANNGAVDEKNCKYKSCYNYTKIDLSMVSIYDI